MNILVCAIFTAALLFATRSIAAEAPEHLKGKSIVVRWGETREQRDQEGEGWGALHVVSATHALSIYVSTKGRVFSRQTNSTGSGTAHMDQVGAQGGGGYPVRTPSFNGQTMIVIEGGGKKGGAAKRTVIDFDAGFANCSAKTAMGFEAGKSGVSLSPITHKMVDIKAVTVSGESCSVQIGNVLGGPV